MSHIVLINPSHTKRLSHQRHPGASWPVGGLRSLIPLPPSPLPFSRAELNANREFFTFFYLFIYFYLCGRRGSLRGQRSEEFWAASGRQGLSCGLEAVGGVEGGQGGGGAPTGRRPRISGEPGGLEEVEPEDKSGASSGRNLGSRVTKGRHGKKRRHSKAFWSHMTERKPPLPHLNGCARRLPAREPVALIEDYKFSVLFSSSSFCVA